jgi:hypothetical protein
MRKVTNTCASIFRGGEGVSGREAVRGARGALQSSRGTRCWGTQSWRRLRPTVSLAKNSLVYFISTAYIDRPVLRGHGQEAKRGKAGGHRITRNCAAFGLVLLTYATIELSLIAMWCLIGATPRGQPWTPAVTLPQGCDGLSARRMAVLWTFHEPSLCRHVHRELLRKAALNLTLIISATACHQRNYVERYSRFSTWATNVERRRTKAR